MLWFNRLLWPTLILALIPPQIAFYRNDRPDACAVLLLLQLGIVVFVWHDWERKSP
jgi:hypothetical protein